MPTPVIITLIICITLVALSVIGKNNNNNNNKKGE